MVQGLNSKKLDLGHVGVLSIHTWNSLSVDVAGDDASIMAIMILITILIFFFEQLRQKFAGPTGQSVLDNKYLLLLPLY